MCVSDAATRPDDELLRVYEAVMRIRSRELTLRKAAQIYGIPRSTLSDRVNGRVKLSAKRIVRYKRHLPRQAPEVFLDNAEEDKFVNDFVLDSTKESGCGGK